ncbi:MAG: bifunctional phosphopantothenoylcysteine decarboxylase/phosphopantothenate--cysteine ligase CoaBC [Desulfovibrionaceae bacterium]|nr:bifunctional phosphopantothenoylcysteine decarboxylase/phosphopantothenate--cysteine ligase CoaBC [Desulfovibrionaceae bacterium]
MSRDRADNLCFTGYLGKRVHLGVTGSVAAYRALDLLRRLLENNCAVSATLTRGCQRFLSALLFEALGADPVYTGMFDSPDRLGHLEPGKNADVLVVAPATADIIAKLAAGLADDMLSCQALAFSGPKIVAPAMNPAMWENPATRENWAKLLGRGFIGVGPACGGVACGDKGAGRLAEVFDIHAAVLRALSPNDLAGKKILVSLGPTREHWDPARFWSNPSTGIMGTCLALAAWLRGAEVVAVAGPVDTRLPEGLKVVRVASAREMLEAVGDLWPDMDAACMCAAVADFRPKPFGRKKFKKKEAQAGLSIEFLPNPDILLELGASKRPGQRLIGFAAETSSLNASLKTKLKAKNLDLIVGNYINVKGSGFGTMTNKVVVADAAGRIEQWPELPKTEVAWRIWDLLLQL